METNIYINKSGREREFFEMVSELGIRSYNNMDIDWETKYLEEYSIVQINLKKKFVANAYYGETFDISKLTPIDDLEKKVLEFSKPPKKEYVHGM